MDLRWIARLAIGLFALSGPGLVFAGDSTVTPSLDWPERRWPGGIQKGGYIIFFRHGMTMEFTEKDVTDANLDNCQIQRNLSEEGRTQTRQIGEAFRRLQIPIGDAYSSPYCRCLETAKNIFGKAEKSKALHFAIQLRPADRAMVTTHAPQYARDAAATGHEHRPGLAHRKSSRGGRDLAEARGRRSRVQARGEWTVLLRGRDDAGGVAVRSRPGPGTRGYLSTLKEWFGGPSDR